VNYLPCIYKITLPLKITKNYWTSCRPLEIKIIWMGYTFLHLHTFSSVSHFPLALFRLWRHVATNKKWFTCVVTSLSTAPHAHAAFERNYSCRKPFDSVSCCNSCATMVSFDSACDFKFKTTAFFDKTVVPSFMKPISCDRFPLVMTRLRGHIGALHCRCLFVLTVWRWEAPCSVCPDTHYVFINYLNELRVAHSEISRNEQRAADLLLLSHWNVQGD
jgi:hypothetical protein